MADSREPVVRPAGSGRGDRFAAVLIFIVSALYVRFAVTFQPPFFRSEALGPATFPLMIGGMMLLLSTALFIQSFRATPGPATHWAGVGAALALWAMLLVYVLLFDQAGFLLSTAVFLSGGFWLLGVRPWWKIVLYAAIFTAATFYIFNVLDVRLPAGEWFRRRP
jgi:putative tricarboxylic transport membrane protein